MLLLGDHWGNIVYYIVCSLLWLLQQLLYKEDLQVDHLGTNVLPTSFLLKQFSESELKMELSKYQFYQQTKFSKQKKMVSKKNKAFFQAQKSNKAQKLPSSRFHICWLHTIKFNYRCILKKQQPRVNEFFQNLYLKFDDIINFNRQVFSWKQKNYRKYKRSYVTLKIHRLFGI